MTLEGKIQEPVNDLLYRLSTAAVCVEIGVKVKPPASGSLRDVVSRGS